MRFFTYVGLVLRRIWAKRGMLFGSWLGATLVVALLVIVPLYESSIAAVDLLFTFRQAPAVEVDLRASATTNQYRAEEAAAARVAVADAQAEIATWYPTNTERTLSREFRFIPPGPPADWFARAEDWRAGALSWREEVARLLSEASTIGDWDAADLGDPTVFAAALARPESLPEELAAAAQQVGEFPELDTPPYPQPPQEPTVTRILTAPDIADHIEIVAGDWPGDQPAPAGRSDPRLQVVLGEDVARLAGLAVGDETLLRPFISLPSEFEIVAVAGIARAVEPTDPIWAAVAPGSLAFVPQETFDAWTRPLTPTLVDEDRWLRGMRGFPALTTSQSWYLAVDRESANLENVQQLADGVRSFSAELGRVSGVAVSTALPALLESFDLRTTVFGAPILAMLALVVAGALYFLIYTAGLTLEREGPELALLRTRGAGRWQTVGIHLLQSGVIAIVAALVAPFVARFMVAMTGLVPPMSDLTGGDPLAVSGASSIVPYVVAGAVLTFVTMGLAVLPIARRSILELRSLAARPEKTSFWQKYYIDVFLVILAAILLFELRQRGIVEVGEDPGLDPFAVASPALFLIAGAFLLLRVLPLLLRLIGWVMTRAWGMGAALPGWHLGRNPVPYGRLALLIWLTTGFGAFALTYAQTLENSYDDRAAFAAGSDARVVAERAGFLDVPDGTSAAAVFRSQGAPRLAGRGTELLAIRPDEFAAVVAWRSDFGADTAAAAFAVLRAEGPPDTGVELPEGTTALQAEALHLRSLAEEPGEGAAADPLQILARVADGRGRLWTFASTPLPEGEWGTVELALDAATALNDGPPELRGPLVLQSLWLEREIAGGNPVLANDYVYFDGFSAVAPGGEVPLTAQLGDEMEQFGFRRVMVAGDDPARLLPPDAPPGRRAAVVADHDIEVWQLPTVNRLDPVPHIAAPGAPLRVLLDAESAGAAQIDVGDEAEFGIEGEIVSGVRVGAIDLVPTTGDRQLQGVMVADLDAVLHALNAAPAWSLTGTLSRVAEPGELWIDTDDPDGAIRFVTSQLQDEPDEVVTLLGASTDFSSRPVQVGLVAVLFVGSVTGVVLALAGVTGYVLVAVRRRAREMGVLRALGLGRGSVASTFAVEQLVVLAVGAVIGVVAGVALMRLVLPFLQLGETAEEIVPAVELVVQPPLLLGYLAVVALLLVMSVLWATRTVSAKRLSEVLREVDR